MSFINSSTFKKYLLPGFVFQSVVIGGGYGTGRELVEYFLKYGPLGGLLGMVLVTTVSWSILLALTFEFSRKFRAYDYRTFFKNLLGPFWPVFEIIYTIYLLIVLGVIGSAAGTLLKNNLGLPYILGVIIILAAVGFLTFKGSKIIENFLSLWSIVLYTTFAVLLVVIFIKFTPQIRENFANSTIHGNWAGGAMLYAFYNMAAVPAVFFCLTHINKRKEAIFAGLLAGPIGIIPAVFLFLAMVSHYEIVLEESIPIVTVIQKSGVAILLIAFQIILFGTLIETGTGLIHAVNERIQSALHSKKKELPTYFRPLLAVAFLIIAVCISTLGLKTLIDKGYGAASWGFLFVYLIPLTTIGLYKIIKKSK